MEQVIVAFENETSCKRIRDLLEGAGAASCIVCRTAGQVRRAAGMCPLVVCGYKFPDGTAEDLFEDLPPACAMLLVAKQSLLDLCRSEGMFRLAAPVAKGDLLASVRMLLQMGGRPEGYARRPSRSLEDAEVLAQAKAVLMDRHGMTEEQAHRFLQKKSMDSGSRLVQTALLVLENP